MSRIIRGESSDVKAVGTQAHLSQRDPYRGVAFRSMRVEGTFTRDELEAECQKARAEGRIEGAKDAEKKLNQPLRQAVENAEKILDELSKFRRELFQEASEEVFELVRLITKRVVIKELKLQPDILKEVTSQAIGLLEKQKRVSLELSPSDYDGFAKSKEDFLQKFSGLEDLEILKEPRLPPGVSVVKTKLFEIDVKLDALVDSILDQVKAGEEVVHKTNDEEDTL